MMCEMIELAQGIRKDRQMKAVDFKGRNRIIAENQDSASCSCVEYV